MPSEASIFEWIPMPGRNPEHVYRIAAHGVRRSGSRRGTIGHRPPTPIDEIGATSACRAHRGPALSRFRIAGAFAALVWVALAGVAATPARADQAPSCNRESLGQAHCFSPKLCACIHDRGGSITGTPSGYRWDCGTLRPSCGENVRAPATMNEFKGPYPLAIGIDRSNQNVEIR